MKNEEKVMVIGKIEKRGLCRLCKAGPMSWSEFVDHMVGEHGVIKNLFRNFQVPEKSK